MKKINLRLLQAIVILICSIPMYAQPTFNSGNDPRPSNKQWVKVDNLTDEFDGNSLNSNKWTADPSFIWNGQERGWYGSSRSLFEEDNATVTSGQLRIEGEQFDAPKYAPSDDTSKSATRKYGGAYVYSKTLAKPGYYMEARMKASNTAMSAAFWLMSEAKPCVELPNNGEKCELDIQECVGIMTGEEGDSWTNDDWAVAAKWDRIFHFNTHRHNSQQCYTGSQQTVGGKVNLDSGLNRDAFHIYGAYWHSNGLQVDYFLDGQFIKSVTPAVQFSAPLKLIMSSNFYDWIEETTKEGMGFNNTKSERSTKFDWVRTWELEDAPIGTNDVNFTNAPSSVVTGNSFNVTVTYTASAQYDLTVIVEHPDGTWLTGPKKVVGVGSGSETFSITQSPAWEVANGYALKVALRDVGGDWTTNKALKTETFNVTNGNLASFQNQGSFSYMSSENENLLDCIKSTAGTNEKFEIVDAGNDLIALKGSNGKYVSSENGTKELTCIRTSIGAWEKFTMVDYGNGIYALKGNNDLFLRNNMLCTSTTVSTWQQFKVTTGLKSVTSINTTDEGAIKVYPNPANDILNIKLNSIEESALVSIIDLSGKSVNTFTINGAQTSINTSELSGIYIIRVETKSKTLAKRVIIQ